MNTYDGGFGQMIQQLRGEFNAQLNKFGGFARQQQQQIQSMGKSIDDLGRVTSALRMQRTSTNTDPMGHVGYLEKHPGVIRIEDIPGRRVPYDLLVDIPIGNNTTSPRDGTLNSIRTRPLP